MLWQEDFFWSFDGTKIFVRKLLPVKYKAQVLLIHGYAQHSGCYLKVIQRLAEAGLAIWALDLRGHGRSARHLGDLPSFQAVLEDLIAIKEIMISKNGRKNFFILGHSLGGCLALCLSVLKPEKLSGTIAIAPMVLIPEYISPVLKFFSSLLAFFIPRLGLQPFSTEYLVHDESVLDLANLDPYYYRGRIKARTGYQLLKGIDKVRSLLPQLKTPLLILHGSEDKIMPQKGSQYVFESVSTKDKTLHIFENLYHEILNEKENEKVWEVITTWLNERF